MEEQQPKEKKQEKLMLYLLYATAAYFGLQLMFRSSRAAAVTVRTDQAAGPPPPNYGQPPVQQAAKTTPAVPLPDKMVFPIRKGARGAAVKLLQQKLGVAADGIFGPKTEAALKKKYGVIVVSQALYRSLLPQTLAGRQFIQVRSKDGTGKWVEQY